jgi:hypothetical protein
VNPRQTGPSEEVVQLHDKLQKLQAACEAYKTELDRVNHLRQRRTENSQGVQQIPVHLKTSSNVGHSNQAVFLFVFLAFFIGYWFF